MRWIATFGVFLMFIPLFLPLTIKAAAPPRLKTQGNQIVTESGQPIRLKGAKTMRSEWDLSIAWERDTSIPNLATVWKGNIIGRGFASNPVNNPNHVYTAPWGSTITSAQYMSFLDTYVALGEQYGMYVVFLWRTHEVNGAPQPTRPDNEAKKALATLAARYKDKPHVIYALQEEPHDVTWSELRPFYEEMVDAIRAASAPHKPLIMIPGVQWSHDISGAITDPVRRENVVYKSHPYGESPNYQKWFLDTYDAGLPIFIGEFGTADPAENTTQASIDKLLEITRQRNIGWMAWIFDYSGPPVLLKTRTGLEPTVPYGISVNNEMTAIVPFPSTSTQPSPSPTPISKSGDVDGDGDVDGVDYIKWLNNYTKTNTLPIEQRHTVGDFNRNGITDGIDYTMWLNNYGK